VWTQLRNNTWIYFAPHSDTLTILCPNGKPIDVTVRGTGKFYVYPGCQAYSATAIVYGNAAINNSSTFENGDLLSQVTVHYDCCEEAGNRVNLSQLNPRPSPSKDDWSPRRFEVCR
jgi:hypothetical protein